MPGFDEDDINNWIRDMPMEVSGKYYTMSEKRLTKEPDWVIDYGE